MDIHGVCEAIKAIASAIALYPNNMPEVKVDFVSFNNNQHTEGNFISFGFTPSSASSFMGSLSISTSTGPIVIPWKDISALTVDVELTDDEARYIRAITKSNG